MEIRPIFSALRRHKTAAALIVIEIALSCAIICNALFLINGRLDRMDRVSGLDEKGIVRVQLTGIGRDDNADALTQSDLAALRSIPGVKFATSTNQVTFGNGSWNSSVQLSKDQTHATLNATTYLGDEQLVNTLGLRLIAGRQFTPDEFLSWTALNTPGAVGNIPAAIITRSMAEKMFPGENALGKVFYSWGEEPIKIVGIVDHLVRPNEQGGPSAYEYSMIFPIRVPFSMGGNYLLRTDPERRAEVLKTAVDTLQKNNANRIILEQQTMEELRDNFYRQDRSMAWLLVAVCVALLIVTALGIIGLASFWVQQRSKQIGVRRALGATRRQILRYFQTENFLLASLGIVLGMALAYGINQMLMGKYELPRLPLYYLPVGAVLLWLLGQVSVLGPAIRAAAVPPAVATRSA
ncbi:ABC transporter permease [Pseudoxanthomonas indica]|uniref:Putative ABC transport system permease protein n=1 Tax=Pseudoxanthomonas indica TaxID=428993 RepID=A0A1T5K4Q0_9GAMM|nr:FtsX-like permease family protein [Pseudoxanthomonas indica]GGD46767.1 ABC transporter permease [Pseudoxanthomonas indica]SKC58732.1 putative ABC transport system permease protein [Pseudoxanthomonas indica]